MRPGWLVSVQSLVFAFLLHAAALALLLVSFSFTPEMRPVKPVSIVNAVTVDKAKVDEEIKRLKQEDENKQRRAEELEKKLEADKKKAEEIKNQRLEEEKQLITARKQKEEEQKKHEEMQQKVAELEQQRKLEEEKKAKAEAEKKKKEAELKKKEEENKREAATKALQEQLEAEQAEEQRQQDATLLDKITYDIYKKVSNNFTTTGLPEGLTCTLRVKLIPGGEVLDASIIESSGNETYDRNSQTAVLKSSPLPVPDDAESFDRLGLREFTFRFKFKR